MVARSVLGHSLLSCCTIEVKTHDLRPRKTLADDGRSSVPDLTPFLLSGFALPSSAE